MGMNTDKLVQRLLDSTAPEYLAERRDYPAGEVSVFGSSSQQAAFMEGNLEVTEISRNGLPISPDTDVLESKSQGLRGPNYIINFTKNINILLAEADFTAADFRLWYYVQEHLWYFNYIPINQAQIARHLKLSPQTVNSSVKKFLVMIVWDKVPTEEIPKILQDRGTWYRVNPNLLWMGKVANLEAAPSFYTITRRKNARKKKLLIESFEEMIRYRRLELVK